MNHQILVIDDDKPLRLLYRSELAGDGYNVITAGSAEEGLRLLSENAVDLILLDIEMPDQSGLEALQSIRKQRPG